MKKLLVAGLAMLGLMPAYSQFTYDIQEKDLAEIKAEAEDYFAILREEIGEEEFHREGGEYTKYQEFLSYWEPRVGDHGSFELFLKAHESWAKTQDMWYTKQTSPNYTDWTEIGPIKRAEFGDQLINNTETGVGPIEFLEIWKGDLNSEKLICGSEKGGLFYSTDGADTWHSAGSDGWFNSGCKSATVHPNDFDTWYALGQARAENPELLGFLGGLWRTNNGTASGGATWTQIADPNKMNISWAEYINKVVICPDDPDLLFLATTDGIRYCNTIETQPVANHVWNNPSTIGGRDVHDLEFRINSTEHLFATVWDGEIWICKESTDGGVTWSNLPNQPTWSIDLTGSIKNAVTLEVTAADPDVVYFYSPKDGVFKYDISSQVFIASLPYSAPGFIYGDGHAFGVSQFTLGDYIESQGMTIRMNIASHSCTFPSWPSSSNPAPFHGDVEDVVFDPNHPDVVWITTHGGVSKSLDLGCTWEYKGEGIGNAEVWGLAASQSSSEYVAIGLYHQGTMLALNASQPVTTTDWSQIYEGDGMDPHIDYDDPSNVWYGAQYGSYKYSANYGASDQNADPGMEPWVKWVKQHVDEPQTIFAGRNSAGGSRAAGIMRSNDWGKSGTYTQISDFTSTHGLTNTHFIKSAYPVPNQPDYLYAAATGTAGGDKIAKTTNVNDASVSWSVFDAPSNYGSHIAVDPYNPDLIYVGSSSNISASNWTAADGTEMVFRVNTALPETDPNYKTDITHNLPNVGVADLVIEQGSDGALYLLTDVGVYYTNNKLLNNGTNWIKFGELPSVSGGGNGNKIEINYEVNRIRVGLFGRGVWERNLYCPVDAYFDIPGGTHFQDITNEVTGYIHSAAAVPATISVRYRAGTEIVLKPGFGALSGSTFEAFIHRCDQPGNSFKDGRIPENQAKENVEDALDSSADAIVVFPNPTNGVVTIQNNAFTQGKAGELIVFDLQGRQVLSRSFSAFNAEQVDLSAFDTGIYFLRLNIEGHSYLKKVIYQ